eukprot:s721_g3.t1
MLRGVLEDGEEIGLELVPGYRLRVLKLKFRDVHERVSLDAISAIAADWGVPLFPDAAKALPQFARLPCFAFHFAVRSAEIPNRCEEGKTSSRQREKDETLRRQYLLPGTPRFSSNLSHSMRRRLNKCQLFCLDINVAYHSEDGLGLKLVLRDETMMISPDFYSLKSTTCNLQHTTYVQQLLK